MAEKYPIPWIATYFLAALVLIAGGIFFLRLVDGFGGDYDRYDPDFEYLERIARSKTPRQGDFAKLNGGDWQALCLVGSKALVAEALRAAQIPEVPATAIRDAYDVDAPELHATEFALAYVKGEGDVKLLRAPHGYAFARAGQAMCTERAKPVMALPVGTGK